MKNDWQKIVDAFGGITALARAMDAPVSTVFNWKRIGIPRSRMAHIRLAAIAKGVTLP